MLKKRSIKLRLPSIIEKLEARRLLSATIQGTLWEDIDADGFRDAGDNGLAGWTLFLDQNANQSRDIGERTAQTSAAGTYAFTGLAAGSYRVTQEMPLGWEQTSPTAVTGLNAGVLSLDTKPTLSESPLNFTSTVSSVPVFSDGSTASTEVVVPLDAESNVQIGLNGLRTNPQFSGIDGAGFSIVVLDTGIDLNHPFFGPDADQNGVADRIVYQHDFADNDANASDMNGHGSNVASIAAGQDTTLSGMAPGANIIALKVFQDSGSGQFSYIEQALQWVVANTDLYNIASVNMSLGDTQNWSTAQSLYGLSDELATLASNDVIVVSAAGNEYYNFQAQGVSYPAADPNSLAVSAVYDANVGAESYSSGAQDYSTAVDRVASFSQRSGVLTDIFAPGAIISGANASGGVSGYAGTSQASPHIAGLAAVAQHLAVQQIGRRLTLAEFRDILRSTGQSIVDGDDERDNVRATGLTYERVNAEAMAVAIYNLRDDLLHAQIVNVTADQTLSDVDFGNHVRDVVPGRPDLLSASDTGISSTDNLTRLNGTTGALTFAVPGTIFGATISLYDGSTLLASAAATEGTTTLTAGSSVALSNGSYAVTARQAFGVLTPSSPSLALTITVDTVAPAAPGAPDLQSASDTGVSATDNLTRIATPTFTLNTSTGLYERFYRGSALISAAYFSGSTLTASAAPVGSSLYRQTFVDAAGNESLPGASLAVTYDPTAPVSTISSVASPRSTPVASVNINFDGPVVGFDRADVRLTRDGSANLLTASHTLTSSDSTNFTLADLSGVSATSGNYTLTLLSTGTGITDRAGNALAVGRSISWTVSATSVSPVSSLKLIDSDTNAVVTTLVDGQTIDLSQTTVRNFNIRAETATRVGSVRFDYNGQASYHYENSAPYALFGDDTRGDYYGQPLSLGAYTVTATAYASAYGNGAAATPLTVRFNVIATSTTTTSALAINQLAFIDSDTDQSVLNLVDGQTLRLSELPTRNFNIRALPSGSAVRSVRFGYQGNPDFHVESQAPFTLFGDDQVGGYFGQTLAIGSYTIDVTAFDRTAATGNSGPTLHVRFTVVA